jgi:hypothetical protein
LQSRDVVWKWRGV